MASKHQSEFRPCQCDMCTHTVPSQCDMCTDTVPCQCDMCTDTVPCQCDMCTDTVFQDAETCPAATTSNNSDTDTNRFLKQLLGCSVHKPCRDCSITKNIMPTSPGIVSISLTCPLRPDSTASPQTGIVTRSHLCCPASRLVTSPDKAPFGRAELGRVLSAVIGSGNSSRRLFSLGLDRTEAVSQITCSHLGRRRAPPGMENLQPWTSSRGVHQRWASLSRLVMLSVSLLAALSLLPLGAAVVSRKEMGKTVVTRYGKVRGVTTEFPNPNLKPIDSFFDLRYADLERGNIRFMPPKNPKEQWTNTRMALQQQPQAACPQPSVAQQQHVGQDGRTSHLRNISYFVSRQVEDCLTLNLFVPQQKWNDSSPMPVMVFIHGHSYDTGTGNAYDGSVLSSFGDVIVVTLNYRLGVLGFLTTLDQSAMGNLGLFDITQALLWLQDNIASFSGDPKRVTLFGHGHGAALVNLLLLSPFVSEGRGPFFQQAIIQSGAALSTWAVSFDPVWCTQKLAINVNCSAHIGDTSGLVNCLRRRTVAELINGAPEPPKYYSCFAPAVDEWTFLPTQPEKLMKERNSKFASVPVMFGITKNEAYAYLKQQEIHKGLSNFRKTQIIRTYVQNVYRYHRQKIYEILDNQYTDWTKPADHMSSRDSILELLSDGQYVAPLIKTANYHAQTADTYLYTFSHSTQSETDADHGPEEEIQGIHGDELPYVFGSPLVDGVSPFPSTYTAAEKMLSEAVMTYWTNFAKSGNPNFPRNQSSVHGGKVNNRFVGLTWPKYDKEKQEYLQISRRPAVRHHYRSQKLAVWLDLIPKINVPDSSDSSSHLLANFNNQSTFDDYHRLLPPFDNVFPSPPPMPPISPTITHPPTFVEKLSTSEFGPSSKTRGADGVGSHPWHNMRSRPDVVTADEAENGVSSANEAVSTLPVSRSQGPEGGAAGQGHWTGPLSITVAVGCTLLFLNILIFGAMYYQRYHIRKMRLSGAAGSELATDGSGHHNHNELDDPDDIKLSRKIEREATRHCGPVVMGPETDSLLSAGTGGGGSVVGVGEGASYLARAEESPSRDLGISSSSTLGRRTPPTSVTTAAGGAIGNGKKGGGVPGGKLSRGPSTDSGYTYSAVPTHTASPLHRPQIHVLPHPHQSHNPTPSTLPHPYVPHSQPHPPPLVMHTFANSISSLGRGPRYNTPPLKAVAASSAADTGLYQVINKGSASGNTPERGGASSSTNAITIV